MIQIRNRFRRSFPATGSGCGHLCRSRLVAAALFGLLVLALAGCSEDETLGPKTFTYTITDSGGRLLIGARVVVVNAQVQGTCTAGSILAPQHSGDAAVVIQDTATVQFTLSYQGPYIESVYIDANGSNNLNSGDFVWGIDPADLSGACVDSMAVWEANQAFDWGVVATNVFGGFSTYSGTSQPFGTLPGTDASASMAVVPLDGGRY
jgi:hypothetical protein